jgi:hypothetical protein
MCQSGAGCDSRPDSSHQNHHGLYHYQTDTRAYFQSHMRVGRTLRWCVHSRFLFSNQDQKH